MAVMLTQIRLAVIAGSLAVAFWAGWSVNGWRHDAALLEAEKQQNRLRVAADRSERARLEAETQAATLAQQLEDMANADPDTAGGLPAARVERLLRR
jgi:hypothetical protein